MSTLIIAEAGVNHNGNWKIAQKLVDAAVDAGADIIKFQTFRANRLATTFAPKADYQRHYTSEGQSQLDMLRQLELTADMHEQLIAYCSKQGISFLSTAFDIQSVDYLAGLGVDRFKIPSGEITNLPYLRHIGEFGRQLILSTGMATLGEIEAALDALETAGTTRSLITVLHCNTEYPTPMRDVNLIAMARIRDAFGVAVGYSDHTIGIEVPIAAVALGATVIEKHLTLDRNLPGPDHRASLEPNEFTAMVCAIRNIEEALGDGIKRPSPSEVKNKAIVRKSLVAAKPIKAGEPFTPENLTTKRPGTGISPLRWDEVIGQTATRNYSPDELIEP
jgi:N,N'-diacetyllegionaminate synthase